MLSKLVLAAAALTMAVTTASASQLVYRPTSPSLGGDPLNGNWLLSQATAQGGGGSGGGGFVIDFPDFGNLPGGPDDDQDGEQPPVPTNPDGNGG